MHCPPGFGGRFEPHPEWGFNVRDAEFLSLVRRHGVKLVCCAHALFFDHHVHDGTHFVVSGGGGPRCARTTAASAPRATAGPRTAAPSSTRSRSPSPRTARSPGACCRPSIRSTDTHASRSATARSLSMAAELIVVPYVLGREGVGHGGRAARARGGRRRGPARRAGAAHRSQRAVRQRDRGVLRPQPPGRARRGRRARARLAAGGPDRQLPHPAGGRRGPGRRRGSRSCGWTATPTSTRRRRPRPGSSTATRWR